MNADQGQAGGEPSRHPYDKPPIVEALCQFNFAEPIPWSPILPGMFYQRIRAEYPTEPEVQQQVQANVAFQNDAAGQAQFTVGQGDQRLIYKNDASNRLIVLSPSNISANSLPEYEGWENLRERFERALNKTRESLRSAQVNLVTIRYINRIFVPSLDPVDLEEFFNIPYRKVGGGGATISGAFQRVETTLSDGVTRGLLNFGILDPSEDESEGQAFMLDLEFRREVAQPCDFQDALSVADDLKRAENDEFEACVTHKARELFQ